MARRLARRPGQPAIWRALLWLYEFGASLKLAVILLSSAAIVLGSATFIESKYGSRAVQFGMYGTWWFTLLNLLLAINIFCAAAIRYPWKRYQTGFVITHIGLLTLMFGTLLSRRYGIDAQMPIFEESRSHLAYEDSEHFELTILPDHTGSELADEPSGHAHEETALEETIAIPFVAGPFNWADYKTELTFLPWRLAHRDQGVLYDRDGIRLELLDYYSNSRQVDVPMIELAISNPRQQRQDDEGRTIEGPETESTIELAVRAASSTASRPFGVGNRQMMGGGQIVFWLAGSENEVQAFLDSRPEGSLGRRGQVVLGVAGKTVRLNIDDLEKGERTPLADTGFEVELVDYYATAMLKEGGSTDRMELIDTTDADGEAKRPAVELALFQNGKPAGRLVLLAGLPEFNVQDYEHQVFGSYWFDHGEKSTSQLLAGEGGSRIDVIEGPQGKLYYRYWNRREVVTAAELPSDGTKVNAFKMPIAQLTMRVAKHYPSTEPSKKVLPLPFDPKMTATDATRAAKVRLTVDGNGQEFWVVGPRVMLIDQPLSPSERRVVPGKGRRVALTMPLDEIDVGFQIGLKKFSRKLDPGTSTPSHYSSVVDLLDRDDEHQPLRRDVLITMNAPVDFSDPQRGYSYRLFQESFNGPYLPGSPIYEQVYRPRAREKSWYDDPDKGQRDQLFVSVLTVNRDPGRGVKYVGCLLVVAGIVTMFYMGAYFFTPRKRAAAEARPAAKQEPLAEPLTARG